jgi:hypothetical protein
MSVPAKAPAGCSGARWRLKGGFVALGIGFCSLSQAQEAYGLDGLLVVAGTQPEWTVEVSRSAQDPLSAGIGVQRTDFPAAFGAPASPTVQQTMVWLGRSRWSAGLGVERAELSAADLRFGTGLPYAQEGGLVLGLAFRTSERTRLVWETPISGFGHGGPETQLGVRVGLRFKGQDRFAQLRSHTLLKLHLDDRTVLSVKPRRGRLSLTLATEW